jgi:hypothetical protein
MAETTESSGALTNLRKHLQKEQYGKALEICDKSESASSFLSSDCSTAVLAQNPADMDLYKVKILCCIHLQKFDDALEIADFNGEFAFEKAYCLYRKNRVRSNAAWPLLTLPVPSQLNDAVAVCNSVSSKSDAMLNLQAQTVSSLSLLPTDESTAPQAPEI